MMCRSYRGMWHGHVTWPTRNHDVLLWSRPRSRPNPTRSFQDVFYVQIWTHSAKICGCSVAGDVKRFQNQAKLAPANFKHNPIFYFCKIVIKNQHQLQENCDEIDLIYVSFTSALCMCAPLCFAYDILRSNLFSEWLWHMHPHSVLHILRSQTHTFNASNSTAKCSFHMVFCNILH